MALCRVCFLLGIFIERGLELGDFILKLGDLVIARVYLALYVRGAVGAGVNGGSEQHKERNKKRYERASDNLHPFILTQRGPQ